MKSQEEENLLAAVQSHSAVQGHAAEPFLASLFEDTPPADPNQTYLPVPSPVHQNMSGKYAQCTRDRKGTS